MTLTISSNYFIPNDVVNTILTLKTIDLKTISRFIRTCSANTNYSLFIDEVIRKIVHTAMDSKHDRALFGVAQKLGPEQLRILSEVRMDPRTFQKRIDPILQEGINVEKFHLLINGHLDVGNSTKIQSPTAITTLTFEGLRDHINYLSAERLLKTFSNVSKLIISSTVWLKQITLQEESPGIYSPSFSQVREVKLNSKVGSKKLIKLFQLFPNLEKATLATSNPTTSIILEGKDRIEKVKKSLIDQPPMNSTTTCDFILTQ
jgi:hypothetical protein